MSLEFIFKNELGEVRMYGSGNGTIRVLGLDGLGPVTSEYIAAVYSGYDGQETVSKRALSRTVTISAEVNDKNVAGVMRSAVRVFGKEGVLYIKTLDFERRIKCSQVQMPDIAKVLKGQIATFVVQFVCDSPYFMDAEDKRVPLYKRKKLLCSPFTLPCMFGEIVLGAEIEILGERAVEPVLTMYYPTALAEVENITIVNETTGKKIKLDYAPDASETVTIDIKNRKIMGSVGGNIINYLSRDTFLGDFVLMPGINTLSVEMGDTPSGFTVGCTYSSLYSEAVIV